jgi:putative transposase
MVVIRGYRFKLIPTQEQSALLSQHAGVCRLVYNLALEQRETWGRSHGLNFFSQSAELTKLRAAFDWISAVSTTAQTFALRDLDCAFVNFFAGRCLYPKYRRQGVDDKFRFKGSEVSVRILNAKWAEVRLPKMGWVRFRSTRKIQGKIKNAAINFDGSSWHVSLSCQLDVEVPAPSAAEVGIDRGVATALAFSNGEMLTLPVSLDRIERRKRKAQRVAARRKHGSNRKRRAQARVARLQAQQARIRKDFNHRAAVSIAERFGVAVLEKLNTRSMTASAKGTVADPGRNVRQKAGLNRGILNAGWRQFQNTLTYKMEERGGQVITVSAAYTSQTCSACGVIDARFRKSQAVFECVSCGHRAHADTNAAIEILRRGSTSSLRVEGSGCGPGEARTLAMREHGLNLTLTG